MFAAAPGIVHAQPGEGPGSPIEMYLEEHDLLEVLAAHLRDELGRANGETKGTIARKLGRLYVQMLDRATTAVERETIEEHSRSLLQSVPEAEYDELRISLAKARYLFAEEIAERHRLRLASDEDRREAEETLRHLAETFSAIGVSADRRVSNMERLEETGRLADEPELQQLLADSRRARSLAMYYAGWSSYYVALISNTQGPALDALKYFGWLLNALPGKPAAPERVPQGLLSYEHVARAAMGCAMAEAIRGNDAVALEWLKTVDNADSVTPAVREQMFARRIVVLATARRWGDLAFELDRRRRSLSARGEPGLPLRESRLVAVATLEALRRADIPDRVRPEIETIARDALAEIVTIGEVGHVVDLVSEYGSAQLGGAGFIVNYVRSVHAYEHAAAAMHASGQSPDQPVKDKAIALRFHEAATLFESALGAADAARYPRQRSQAALLRGMAMFYAGNLAGAADALERAHAMALGPGVGADLAQETLWMAVVAISTAVENSRPSLKPERDRLAMLYLQSYPAGERAAKLLLRQINENAVDAEQAVETLLGVPASSPIYEAARRQAASLLYRLYRGSQGRGRDFAGARFLPVAEEILERDRERVKAGESGDAAQRVVDRVRQILDVVTGISTPDLERAEAALAVLEGVEARAGLDLSAIEGELEYRRFQIALARDDQREADRIAQILGRDHPVFADLAHRHLYTQAREAFERRPDDVHAARAVIEHGRRLMQSAGSPEEALKNDAYASLWASVASAAALIYKIEQDEGARQTAILIDEQLINAGRKAPQVLRRHAELAEEAGLIPAALDSWRTLLAGLSPESEGWYEAKYHTLRLLWMLDPTRARSAMEQHKLLNPELGPEPWGAKLRDLSASPPSRAEDAS